MEVYTGNTKVILQVLWERVFMDTFKDVCTYYTLQGREDNYGNKIIETSLRELMRNCLNFIEEKTLIQTNDFKMGECRDHIIVNCTPSATLRFLTKERSTPGAAQRIITDDFHWTKEEW